MEYFSKDMDRLVQELSRLPGIGPKSAQRLAYFLINGEKEQAYALADSIKKARDRYSLLQMLLYLNGWGALPGMQ